MGIVLSSCQSIKLLPFKTIEVNDQLVIATGAGGNSAILVSKDKKHVLIVDTKMGRGARKLYKWTKKNTDNAQITLINTHFHGDHTKGNKFYEKSGRLKNVYTGVYSDAQWLAETGSVKPSNLEELPGGSYKMMHFYGENVHLFSMGAGHTWSDVVVYFERAKTLHIGDLLFSGFHPIIQQKSGASVVGWINGLEDILSKFEDIQVIPGHGEITDKEGIERQRQYLAALLETMDNDQKRQEFKERYRHLSIIPFYSGVKRSLKAMEREKTKQDHGAAGR